jgi:hypothetical protein
VTLPFLTKVFLADPHQHLPPRRGRARRNPSLYLR